VPIESIVLQDKVPVDGEMVDKILGGTSLEYHAEFNNKYLVGTDQGYIVLANKRCLPGALPVVQVAAQPWDQARPIDDALSLSIFNVLR